MPAKGNRRATRLQGDDGYVECAFEDLREGDLFKLYEPDGTLVYHGVALARASEDGIMADPARSFNMEACR